MTFIFMTKKIFTGDRGGIEEGGGLFELNVVGLAPIDRRRYEELDTTSKAGGI